MTQISLEFAAEARQAVASLLADPATSARGAPADWTSVPRLASLLASLARAPSPDLPTFDACHRRMLADLQRYGIELPHVVRPLASRPACFAQFDEGFEALMGAGILRGVRERAGQEVSLTGLIGEAPMDAAAAWMLAVSVVTSAKARPERPIAIVLASARASTAMDESAALSEYLAHLARAIAWARSQAVAVNVWIEGDLDLASFAACTAAAARVIAFPGAVLHAAAGAAGDDAALSASVRWAAAGLVDEFVDDARTRVAIAWNAST